MSRHEAFRRVPVPPQAAQRSEVVTIPAPTRGLILDENEAYMQPGAALICDNWRPTLRGLALRGGHKVWCSLPETTPVISSFSYDSASNHQMFAANATKLYNVTGSSPVLVKSGQTSGNHCASQLANAEGDWMIVVNDTGDPPLRFNGVDWEVMNAAYVPPGGKPTKITGPPGSTVVNGGNLTHVCKYRNRFFFVEGGSMNAWYLDLNTVGGLLKQIPMSGAATKGGKLLFCASWSIDAGDGIDDKLVFCTDLGELLIFTGSNPGDIANWRQEGRYDLSPPLGMNAHIQVGGDLLIATVDGILPTSGAITKERTELELAAVTRPIRLMWREEVTEKREWDWTMCKWDEYGAMFVTWPGGKQGHELCACVNNATGAWARFTGWDATCWIKMSGNMFFGTQKGKIMQADFGGNDDGKPYTATLVGGWDMFSTQALTMTWRQARASFSARNGEPFIPQIWGTTNFVIKLPTPPPIGVDPGVQDLWDEGKWDIALWDAGVAPKPAVRDTGWVSIGLTGYAHAPIVQVQVHQEARPIVDLISISAVFERAGITV